jgi:putative membrane-bound dehydrogenase-like protein
VHSRKTKTKLPGSTGGIFRARAALAAAWLCAHATALTAAPALPESLPPSALRPVVIESGPPQDWRAKVPRAALAGGFEIEVAAAHPLVTHPTMACLDDRGRLFVADCVGVNWNKAQLEANPPNRVLLLEDRDGDGVFDRSTVFADGLTFPQGACWLEGALYVCSPPGLWRLTDRDGDGVADTREKLVDGFDYTGNAADVHGPFWNPANKRLYWCHGRKGHRATGKDGVVVHEGLASGIWSCTPDGSDLRWHALGCGDNPVEVDFTPEGDVLGVQNLYHSNPRGDTLVHFLQGGVYERPDMLKAIEGLPRTLEKMPVLHNFGHVAVSGCTLWRSHPWEPGPLQMLVTHFNTGRLVRMELTRNGSTYAATENAFAKLDDPDVHLTDVLEDRDGSLLVVNTGGWFRIGCPSSLMAKPDITGAVYRLARKSSTRAATAAVAAAAPSPDLVDILSWLQSADPHRQRRACEWLAFEKRQAAPVAEALRALLAQPLDAALEHAALYAAGTTGSVLPADLKTAVSPLQLGRLLTVLDQFDGTAATALRVFETALERLEDDDGALAQVALGIVTRHPERAESIRLRLDDWIRPASVPPQRVQVLQAIATRMMADPGTRAWVARLLVHAQTSVRVAGLRAIAGQTAVSAEPLWADPLLRALQDRALPPALTLDAIRRVKESRLDEGLQAVADDEHQPLSLRLKSLGAMKSLRLNDGIFQLLLTTLSDATAPVSARLESASLLRSSSPEQTGRLGPVFETAGPLELKVLTGLLNKARDAATARSLVEALARNPSLGSQQESVYRTALSSQSPELFESIIRPALEKANAQAEAKRFSLGPLSEKLRNGVADRGREVFESGKGACVACHQIGTLGRAIGPDLSRIGAIRSGRDLLESILFPSNTLARDYEAHTIEVAGSPAVTGVIRGHSAEGLRIVDGSGQEISIPHEKILSDTTLTESLMPTGLDAVLGERDLTDLVTYLLGLR